jgi:hypothetical protein
VSVTIPRFHIVIAFVKALKNLRLKLKRGLNPTTLVKQIIEKTLQEWPSSSILQDEDMKFKSKLYFSSDALWYKKYIPTASLLWMAGYNPGIRSSKSTE